MQWLNQMRRSKVGWLQVVGLCIATTKCYCFLDKQLHFMSSLCTKVNKMGTSSKIMWGDPKDSITSKVEQ